MKPKLTIFFGAGAEIPYGMPSGGEFALDIFRADTAEDKKRFRKEIQNIDITSTYSKWMPFDFLNRSVSAFGKSQQEALLASSLEHKRDSVIQFLKKFATNADLVRNTFESITGIDIIEIINGLGGQFGNSKYGQVIVPSKSIEDIGLFDQDYFGSLIRLLIENDELKTDKEIKLIARGFIELMIGALGKNLIQELNENLFRNSTELSIFDDITGIFSMDYKKAGYDALGYVLELQPSSIRLSRLNKESPKDVLLAFYTLLFERMLISVLDYQSLIDSHFHYLYNPSSEFGKFCKISIFLYTVHRHITGVYEMIRDAIQGRTGYYDDLREYREAFDIKCVSTSNYNIFITEKTGQEVLFLNGSVSDFYDPYRNKIVSEDSPVFKVPFLFTQSGIKPLTSIDMTLRYSKLYENIMQSDAVVVCGFGFNRDDSHINGVFRAAVEDIGKPLIVVDIQPYEKSIEQYKRDLKEKIRLIKDDKVHVVFVDSKRQTPAGPWLEAILGLLKGAEQSPVTNES